MASTVAKPLSRKKIRDITIVIRQISGLNENKAFPIMRFFEYVLPEIVPGFEWYVVPDDQMDGCDGRTVPEKNQIFLKQSVYDGACANNHRDRFTVAHEIGHLLLHSDDFVSLARTNKKIQAYEDPEWQANTFAAELLIPISQIKDLSPKEISLKYKVSVSAATIQLKQVINS